MPLTLIETLDGAFALLAEGAGDAASPFHTPTLASIAESGSPSLRSVVLRGFDAAARRLEMHTDTRSAKHAEFSARREAALHAWDAGRRVQLRLRGEVTLHAADAIASAAWARLQAHSRSTYRVTPGPGTVIASPHATHAAEEDAAFSIFCVLHLHFREVEWLHLGHAGHARARFRWDNGIFTPMWLVP